MRSQKEEAVLDHLCISVSDLARSRRFYEAALMPLGYRVVSLSGRTIGFGVPEGPGRSADPGGDFWLAEETFGPPLPHFAFAAATRAAVDAFFAAALAAGGTDNGAPGLRPRYHPGYYAAFIIDPDGYNVEAVYHRPANEE